MSGFARAISAAYSRFDTITLQILNLLYNTTNLTSSSSAIDSIKLGLREHYITIVGVQGIDNKNKRRAEVIAKIDWRLHKIEVEKSGDRIILPKNWTNGISPIVDEAVNTFNEACDYAHLKRDWYVVYDTCFDIDEINQILGFQRVSSPPWAVTPETAELSISALSELGIHVKLAI